MATVEVSATTTPAALTLTVGDRYSLQNLSTDSRMFFCERDDGAPAPATTDAAYEAGPKDWVTLRLVAGVTLWFWTDHGTARGALGPAP